MFVELSRKEYDKLRPFLKEKGVRYEPSDCTLPGEKEQMVHIEFDTLTDNMVTVINQKIDSILEEVYLEVEKTETPVTKKEETFVQEEQEKGDYYGE